MCISSKCYCLFIFFASISILKQTKIVQCRISETGTSTGTGTGTSTAPPEGIHKNILVIGAGLAGLSAAQALKNAGEKSIAILEANDYIGGRVKTIDVGSIKSDAGATWIEGVKKNPIKKMADKLGFKCVGDGYWKRDMGYDEASKKRFKYRKTERYQNKFIKWLSWLRRKLGYKASGHDAATLFYQENQLKGKEKRIGEYAIEEDLMGMEYGVDSKDISLEYFWEGWSYGGNNCVFPDTFGQISDNLADGLDIYLSTPVDSIKYNDDIIEVNSNGRIFTADKVIVTVSVGVLKENSIIFKPKLPTRKRNAIDRLQMGRLEKAILVFENNFWKKHGMHFVASFRSESMSYYDFTVFYGKPTLVVLIPANFPLMNAFKDTNVIQLCLKQLQSMFQLTSIPQPSNYFVSRWYDDPYFRGSYSYIPVGSSPSDMKKLAEAIDDKVFFAGEATDHQYYSYTHSAFRSGIRVAKEINKKAQLKTFFK